jgi:hypothetical protein
MTSLRALAAPRAHARFGPRFLCTGLRAFNLLNRIYAFFKFRIPEHGKRAREQERPRRLFGEGSMLHLILLHR